jgi:hypothetical protein
MAVQESGNYLTRLDGPIEVAGAFDAEHANHVKQSALKGDPIALIRAREQEDRDILAQHDAPIARSQ